MSSSGSTPGFAYFSALPAEVRLFVQKEAVAAAGGGASMGNLAAVNKEWQLLVETNTFKEVTVKLSDGGVDGPGYLLTILNPGRLAKLQCLVIKAEWPFYEGATPKRNFSMSDAVHRHFKVYKDLGRVLKQLGELMDSAETKPGLMIRLVAIKPPMVACPSGGARLNSRRMRPDATPALPSLWAEDKVHALSNRLQGQLSFKSFINWQYEVILQSPTMSAVTGFAFPPDMFAPKVLKAFLKRFPNLTLIQLEPMCLMSEPRTWRSATGTS